jgi:hypothetical protein
MHTQRISIPVLLIVILMTVVSAFGTISVAQAQPPPAAAAPTGAAAPATTPASTAPADRRFQVPGATSCIPLYSFEFMKCIGGPLAIWASDGLITVGAKILQLSSAIFDFGVGHLIMNFKETLETKLGILQRLNDIWTFFRDLANILIIGIFVFIAISLILGMKEYGQKKLVARVLIIAVLMNFSLLFTKIVIDASNFVAYSIYSQTAAPCSATAFSVGDCLLKPLRITSIWDTSKVATDVYQQAGGGGAGAFKALMFGLLGCIILVILAVVIFYGAFLILARAILLLLLMVTSPIAYATYLAPHFEASQFGWSNWWKSLINNAAFAPLLMMFVSVTILIVQTASNQIQTGSGNTLTPILMDPTTNMTVDGWRVLFIYILGTGFLFISFRMASSLAGSISGIKFGQMAVGVPAAFGAAKVFQGAGRVLQDTRGRQASKNVERINSQMNQARLDKDWGKLEQLRKEKAKQEKKADRSYNFMNTGVGKAIAQKAGLKGAAAGESKGGFVTRAHDKAVKAEPAAKATQLTEENKKQVRAKAKEDVKKEVKQKDTEKKGVLEKDKNDAAAALNKAKTDAAASKEAADMVRAEAQKEEPKLKQEAETKVIQNTIEREPEMKQAKEEVRVVEKEKADMVTTHNDDIQKMAVAAEKMSGDVREKQMRDIEQKKAEHTQAIKAIDARITTAKDKVNTIDTEIKAPLAQFEERKKKAAETLAERVKEHQEKQKLVDTLVIRVAGNRFVAKSRVGLKAQKDP